MTESKYAECAAAIVRAATEQIMECVRSRREIEPASRIAIEESVGHTLVHAVARAAEAGAALEHGMLSARAGVRADVRRDPGGDA